MPVTLCFSYVFSNGDIRTGRRTKRSYFVKAFAVIFLLPLINVIRQLAVLRNIEMGASRN